jgi:hypothetical protein
LLIDQTLDGQDAVADAEFLHRERFQRPAQDPWANDRKFAEVLQQRIADMRTRPGLGILVEEVIAAQLDDPPRSFSDR